MPERTVETRDSQTFNAAFGAGLEEAELEEGPASLLRRRAAAGFQATAPRRRAAYQDFRGGSR